MSRYLRQLARETNAKLRPPSGLRLAPAAPAAYEEVHEERLVPPAPTIGELSRTPPLDAGPRTPPARPDLPRVPETIAAPMTPAPQPMPLPPFAHRSVQTARPISKPVGAGAPSPAESPHPSRPDVPQTQTRMAKRAPSPPESAKAEHIPAVPTQPWREVDHETLETVVDSTSLLAADGRSRAKEPKNTELAIPETVRSWLRPAPDRPVASATRGPAQASPQPVIEVTIGKVEVTIEGDVQPPLRATRRAEPRAAAPTRPAPPARTGSLARQYMDR